MKLATFIALWLAAIVLRLSGAELAEVFSCLWHYIFVQFHLNPSQLLAYQLMSVNISMQKRQMPTAVTRRSGLSLTWKHGGGRGVYHTTIWSKRDVPPSVTSKNTIGFLSSAASAMAGAEQDGCCRADECDKSRLMTLARQDIDQQRGIFSPSSTRSSSSIYRSDAPRRGRKPEQVRAEDLERTKNRAAAGNA